MGAYVPTEQEYMEAFAKWFNDNPGKTFKDLIFSDKVELNGRMISIGLKKNKLRKCETSFSEENMNILIEKYGFSYGKVYFPTQEEYMKAIDMWIKDNPSKTINKIHATEYVEIDGIKINIGSKLSCIRSGRSYLSEENMNKLVNDYGFILNLKESRTFLDMTDDLFFTILDKWLEENPGKTINDIRSREIVIIDNEIFCLGGKIARIRTNKKYISKEFKKIITTKYGLDFNIKNEIKSDEIYLKGFEKWLEENPDKTIDDIKSNTKVIIDGKEVRIGYKLSYIRKDQNSDLYKKIIEKYGNIKLDKSTKVDDDIYLEGFEKWLEENPDKTIDDIKNNTKVIIDAEEISIGYKLSYLRKNQDNELYEKVVKKFGNIKLDKSVKKDDIIYFKAIDEWLKLNPGKTVNDMKTKDLITIDGDDIYIGLKLQDINRGRTRFKEENMKLLKEKYGFKFGTKLYRPNDEEYMNALIEWLKLNPGKTINDIPTSETIKVEGIEVNIGIKLSNMRSGKHLLSPANMKILKEKYGFIQEKRDPAGKIKDVEWFNVIEIWLKLNPGKTINQIKKRTIINYNGKDYGLGKKISLLRNCKETMSPENMKLLREKYGFKTKEELENETGFIRNIEPLRKEKTIIKEKPYEKYLDEFDGNIEKAKEKYNRVLEVKRRLREEKKNKKRPDVSLDEILKYFDIDMEKLDKLLNRVSERESTSSVIKYEEGETLRNYCIRNGYNYSVIYYLYTHTTGRDIDSLIEQYRINGQKKPTTQIYTNKDGEILAKHLLLYLGLDFESISRDTKEYDYTFGEAMQNDVFRKYVTKNEDKWLEEIYDDLIDQVNEDKTSDKIGEDLINVLVEARQNLNGLLTPEEYDKVVNVFIKYIKTMRKYTKLCIGLENNSEKRRQLIENNKLDEHEVTEGTLMALDFELGIKRTDKSLESKRLEILKPLIINWNKYSQEQKDKMAEQYKLTEYEVFMIIKYNKEIRYNLQLIKK